MSCRRLLPVVLTAALPVVLTAAFSFAAQADVVIVDDDHRPGAGSGTEGNPGPADIAISEGGAVRPECQPHEHCQSHEVNTAWTSVTDMTHAADDFTPTGSSISEICWYGIYAGNDPGTDDFTVTYYLDDNGIPGAVHATHNIASPSTRVRTGEEFATAEWTSQVYEYSDTHPAVAVVPGDCYWISLTNTATPDWLWLSAEDGASAGEKEDPPREGNARLMVDETPADDWTDAGIGAGKDLSFCLGMGITAPACGFLTPYDTGYHELVNFDPNHTGDFSSTNLGWDSGDLQAGPGVDDQRRCAQPLGMPTVPDEKPSWSIQQLAIEGFEPGGVTNEFINFEIFTRTALDVAPTPDDMIWAARGAPFD
ncbi:MAG: hypothetical protein ACYTAQ_17345, partial [Planctomycetota bacterium]